MLLTRGEYYSSHIKSRNHRLCLTLSKMFEEERRKKNTFCVRCDDTHNVRCMYMYNVHRYIYKRVRIEVFTKE